MFDIFSIFTSRLQVSLYFFWLVLLWTWSRELWNHCLFSTQILSLMKDLILSFGRKNQILTSKPKQLLVVISKWAPLQLCAFFLLACTLQLSHYLYWRHSLLQYLLSEGQTLLLLALLDRHLLIQLICMSCRPRFCFTNCRRLCDLLMMMCDVIGQLHSLAAAICHW